MLKKIKATETSSVKKYSALKEHIWELQRILDGKKGSPRKSFKSQTEANDEVWSSNEVTEKALAVLATYDERFEASNKDLCDIDKKFDA